MREAYDNNENLTRLADELASAKEFADTVIAGLEETAESLADQIEAAEDSYNSIEKEIDSLAFKASRASKDE